MVQRAVALDHLTIGAEASAMITLVLELHPDVVRIREVKLLHITSHPHRTRHTVGPKGCNHPVYVKALNAKAKMIDLRLFTSRALRQPNV